MASDSEPGPVSPISSIDSDLARALDDDDYEDDSEQQEDTEPVGNGQESVELDEYYDADQQEALAAAEQYLTDDDEAETATAAPEELPAKRRKLNSGDASPKAADTCKHGQVINGLCTWCGKEVHELHQQQHASLQPGQPGSAAGGGGGSGSGLVTLKHMSRYHIELSASEAQRIQQAAASRLLAARKLVLVLDLDHTLLNSTRCEPHMLLRTCTAPHIRAQACCQLVASMPASALVGMAR